MGAQWKAKRWNREKNKWVHYGFYENQETAAHASDTLARTLNLQQTNRQNHQLNFPDDETKVNPKIHELGSMVTILSKRKKLQNVKILDEKDDQILISYDKKDDKVELISKCRIISPLEPEEGCFGVRLDGRNKKWSAYRWSSIARREVKNGFYSNELEAAHASDTLAMVLISKGEHGHGLNFSEKTMLEPIGVAYDPNREKWRAYRWNSKEMKRIGRGWYSDEETAAHASDNLARKLIADGSQGHELNYDFPDANETLPQTFPLSKKMKKLHQRRKKLIKALEADFNADEGPLIQVEEEIEPSRKQERNKRKRTDASNKRKRSFDYEV